MFFRPSAARNGVAACLMVADVALLQAEAIGPAHACLLAAAILAGRINAGPGAHPRLWNALALGALVFFPIDALLLSRNLIGAALRLMSFVVVYRCLNLHGHRELRQSVNLSFVQILAGAASTTEIGFAFILATYTLIALWTLMALASERTDAGAGARGNPSTTPALAMTGATLALGGVLFLVIPHVGTGYLQRSSPGQDSITGFTDRVELGSISRIKKNRAIAMRVRLPSGSGLVEPISLPLRWRGMALDTFDGRSWSQGKTTKHWLAPGPDGAYRLGLEPIGGESPLEQEFILEPFLAPVIFTAPGATRVIPDRSHSMGIDESGVIHLRAPAVGRLRYKAFSVMPDRAEAGVGMEAGTPGMETMARYLLLPRIDPSIAALARRVTASAAQDYDKARLIEDHLRSHYRYTLNVNDSGVADPLAHFLLEGNPGHCEYFATSMAVMLRHLEIPSRVVTGFSAGEWSQLTQSFVVRQSDAHSWVEAWFARRGWATFDPTPAPSILDARPGLMARIASGFDRVELWWDTYVIGLDLLDQQVLVMTVRDTAARVLATTGQALAGTFSFSLEGVKAWPTATALMALALAVLGMLRLRRWRRAPLAAGSPATEAFRRFEATWAARGIRRLPGQTPLELAREIERRVVESDGVARDFVSAYYRRRYGG